MPRRKPKAAGRPGAPARRALAHERVESWDDGEWVVREISGSSSTKPYRCPGCDQLIRPATPHVVAWPNVTSLLGGEAADDRRHWHTVCWRARDRRTRK